MEKNSTAFVTQEASASETSGRTVYAQAISSEYDWAVHSSLLSRTNCVSASAAALRVATDESLQSWHNTEL
jgi:hypothetical protein